jgi:Cof subfamily protein (haloacid dehalogenase superfamily)
MDRDGVHRGAGVDLAHPAPKPRRAPAGVKSLFVQPNIQLLAIDLDGTTVSHDIDISPRVIAAVKAAMQQGVKVVIATGRNVPSTRPFVQRFGAIGPAICHQGGLIYDFATETMLHRITLSRELACDLAALEHAHPTWKAVMYQDQRVYVSDAAYFRNLDSLVGFAPIEAHDLCGVLNGEDPDKILFSMTPAETPAAMRLVTNFVNGRANVVQSHAMFVEINPIGADKGSALKVVAADLGIAQAHVMAIGDQGNDATMVEWAGVGVAMGNGNDVTKVVSKWIAPSIDEDGAAIAIEKFILNGFSTE